jgi:dihydrofolate synthase / folylpolyglutamate synthase
MQHTLNDWLQHAERLHPVGIDLGLERVTAVAERLGFAPPARAPAPRTIIVAGTNGKGSTCLAMERLLLASGQRVGVTVSPHVHRFNERFRIDGREVGDAALCGAFSRIDEARGDTTLSYFEFSALIALLLFRDAGVDVAVLEVGLGGRLDAFNLVSADTAVITSIGLDHQAYLGHELEGIGGEKAGVLRPGQRVVLGGAMTASVDERAAALGSPTLRYGRDFEARQRCEGWDFVSPERTVTGIPWSSVAPHNGALAIVAADLPARMTAASIRRALGGCVIPGRFELRRAGPASTPVLVDVAHNPDGARFLRGLIERRLPDRRWVALTGMLEDKDAGGVAVALADRVDVWICVPTAGARGQSAARLAGRVRSALAAAGGGEARVDPVEDVADGLRRALSLCPSGGGILAFGSFGLVEQVRSLTSGVPADVS